MADLKINRSDQPFVGGGQLAAADVGGEDGESLDLIEIEALARALFEQTAVGVALIETTVGRFVRGNHKFVQLVGYTQSQLLRKTFTEIICSDDVDVVLDKIRQFQAGEISDFSMETRLVHQDGTRFWCNLTVSTSCHAEERPPFDLIVVEDISQRKRAQQQLMQTRFAVDSFSDAMFNIDPSGRIVDVSRAACTYLGYSRDELLSMTVADINPHYSLESWPTHWMQLKREGRLLFESEHQTKDGRLLPVQISKSFFRFEGNEFACAFVRDISHGKSMEAELEHARDELELRVAERTVQLTAANLALQEEIGERKRVEDEMKRLTSLVDATTDFVGTADPDGNVRYVNSAVRRGLNLPDDLKPGQLTIADFHPEWVQQLMVNEAFPCAAENGVWSGEIAWLTQDGREIPTSQVLLAHYTDDGELESFSTICRDITQNRRIEERLGQLAHVNRVSTMGEMASAMAHELNQPLGTIANLSQACVRGIRHGRLDSEEILTALEDVSLQALRAGEIIRGVARFVRKSPKCNVLVDLADEVDEVVRLVGPDFRQQRVRVESHDDGQPVAVMVDKIQIQQVLVNLLRNSMEAMREVPQTNRLIRVDISRQSDCATVRISDTGKGLPKNGFESVVEPYFTTKHGGVGMGLSISRTIVETHGGRLRGYPNPGPGATVEFTLPVADGGCENHGP